MLRVLILLMAMAAQAHAGAWPREKGEQFLSEVTDSDVFGLRDERRSLYAEYGTTDKLTLGVDLSKDKTRMVKALGFFRWPIGATDKPSKIALGLGMGQIDDRFTWRPSLSVGRGFNLEGRQGWIALETRAVLQRRGSHGAVEADLTTGLSTGRRSKAILQLQTGAPFESRAYLRVAPSVVFEHGPGRQFEFGMTAGIIQSIDFTVRFGVWQQF